MKHANVAIFVPHNGCPHQCSFCSQKNITGQIGQPSPEDVHRAAQTALQDLGAHAAEAEIAFFGGSFTAIERGYMRSLLEAANAYLGESGFSGIRVSTRPDAVPEEMLFMLKEYGVTAIELGAQSMDDGVLRKNGRGHTAHDVEDASRRIRRHGFSLGLQMMTGLYGSTPELDYRTAERLASLCPDSVRIYPTVVMKDTGLGRLYESGDYRPLSLEETIPLCARLLDLFAEKGILVIRLGLHDTPELRRSVLAGAWHPALRELCESARFLARAKSLIREQQIPKGEVILNVHPKNLSKMIGQKRANINALQELGWQVRVLPAPELPAQGVHVIIGD